MHKAIRLKVKLSLWIEGEAEPAEDFAALTAEAVRGIIAAGSEKYPGLAVTVEKIEEDRTGEEDEEV
jgi:hypothetical protein